MLLLAIDTAGPDCAVALARGDAEGCDILVQSSEQIMRGHAERLMPMIEAALDASGHSFADLDRIAVTTGPGSFTGVRVGVSAARALALALDRPAVGVRSLAALCFNLARNHPDGTAVAVLDAKRGEVYARAEDIRSGRALVEDAATTIPDLAAALGAAAPPLLLAGSAAPLLAAAMAGTEARVCSAEQSPDIADVARLAMRLPVADAPVPLYLRGADAKPQAALVLVRA